MVKLKIFVILFAASILLVSCNSAVGRKMKGFNEFNFFAKSDENEKTPVSDETAIGTKIGMAAPDFEINLLDGDSGGNLSDLKGTPILLNFWATWCGPCVIEMPDIEEIYNEYGEQLCVLAVNIGETREMVQEFADENGYSFPIALDTELTVANAYSIQTIPQTFILDKDGVIVQHIPFSADKKTFEDALKPLFAD